MLRRLTLLGLLLLFAFTLALPALAQNEVPPACPPADGTASGCATLQLPEGLIAEFYLEGQLLGSGNSITAVIPSGAAQTISVQKISSDEAEFGIYFVYPDTTVRVSLNAGQSREFPVTVRRTYIRGILQFACVVNQREATDALACQIEIDGVPHPEAIPAGESSRIYLDPGDHELSVTLTGSDAGLWTPEAYLATARIRAGQTSAQRSNFIKKAHLSLAFDTEGVAGDIYINGELVAAQTTAYEGWLDPNRTYRVTAANFSDPAAGDLYTYREPQTSVYLRPAQEQAISLRLQRVYLRGFLELACTVRGLPEGASASCLPTLNSAPQDPIPAGQSRTYTLEPGSTRVVVSLDAGAEWAAPAQTLTATIRAGQTQRLNAAFTLLRPTPTPIPGSNATLVHGYIRSNTTWRGEVLVTGDVRVTGNATLTIAPGTIVRVAAHSDVENLETDPFNLRSGINTGPGINGVETGEPFKDEANHITIRIEGTLRAIGTPGQPILITSASSAPGLGDWNEFYFERGTLAYTTVEYNRLTKLGTGAVARNNTFRYALEFGVGASGNSTGAVIEHNNLSYAGHELIYAGGVSMIIRNNIMGPNPMGFGAGSQPTGGICVAWSSNSVHTVEGNTLSGCDVGVMFVGVNPAVSTAALEAANVFSGNGVNFIYQ